MRREMPGRACRWLIPASQRGKPPSLIGNHAAAAGKTACPACPAGMFHVKHWKPGLFPGNLLLI
jgi:hypothetical protein